VVPPRCFQAPPPQARVLLALSLSFIASLKD
jgi:hypothetical protein